MFIGLYIAFYGLRGLKHFVLPTAYLPILAQLIMSALSLFTIGASAKGNLITVQAKDGGVFSLVIDAPCTGIKGMLAYGSLAILMTPDVKTTHKHKALCIIIGLVRTSPNPPKISYRVLSRRNHCLKLVDLSSLSRFL